MILNLTYFLFYLYIIKGEIFNYRMFQIIYFYGLDKIYYDLIIINLYL